MSVHYFKNKKSPFNHDLTLYYILKLLKFSNYHRRLWKGKYYSTWFVHQQTCLCITFVSFLKLTTGALSSFWHNASERTRSFSLPWVYKNACEKTPTSFIHFFITVYALQRLEGERGKLGRTIAAIVTTATAAASSRRRKREGATDSEFFFQRLALAIGSLPTGGVGRGCCGIDPFFCLICAFFLFFTNMGELVIGRAGFWRNYPKNFEHNQWTLHLSSSTFPPQLLHTDLTGAHHQPFSKYCTNCVFCMNHAFLITKVSKMMNVKIKISVIRFLKFASRQWSAIAQLDKMVNLSCQLDCKC